MKDFFNHLKRIAVADSKLFLQPYVAVARAIRRAFRFIKEKARKVIK